MTILKTSNTGVWIQFEPGKQAYFLGDCIDMDSIPNPRLGGIDLIQCWRRDRKGFQTLGKKYSAPGPIEVTISELLPLTASWLERINCPFTLFALETTCGDVGVFKNWQRAFIVDQMEVTEDPVSGLAAHAEDNEIMHEYTLSGVPPRIDVRALTASKLDTTEAKPLNFIVECGSLFCNDDCGPYTLPCDNLIAGADGGVATANLLKSSDAGSTFAATAVDPWTVATINNVGGVCMEISKGVSRWIIVRNTVAATPMKVSISDDSGASWREVTVGSTVAEGTLGPKAIFALDWQHIWIVTDVGNVYFSSDGGETWVNQDAAGASGGADLYAVDFVDENIGFAVGATDVVIKTVDGGVHWTAATATGSGDTLLALAVFNQHRLIVGTNSVTGGSLYQSFDGGITWQAETFQGAATEQVTDIDFINSLVGLMITNTAAPVGSMHHTIDGGHTWQELTLPANLGLNAVKMCGVNDAYVVGNVDAGLTAQILHISG